ncbi:Ctr copper transporter [Biscogniauxia mediterranea]|nr:Ctr copper transporter [Biscogniauxia mediterranea]
MLWNWNTIDACFLSSSWHVTSSGMFAGSCIGVVLLTMSLECLRRAGKEYDRHLARKHGAAAMPPARGSSTPLIETETPTKSDASTSTAIHQLVNQIRGFRPTVLEQAIRAFLHMAQFAVAYIIMLLAMYFNGYIIISIFIGAYIGAFVFHWETLDASRGTTSAGQDPTVCCA